MKRKTAAKDALGSFQFLPAPPDELTAYYKVNFPGYPGPLAAHFGNPETTIITSEIAAALIPSRTYVGVRYPDLLIAFDADPVANEARLGYLIPEQGTPRNLCWKLPRKAPVAAMRQPNGKTMKGWESWNTGDLTHLAAGSTAPIWPAIGLRTECTSR